jgi:hypothetical protein
MSGEDFEYDEKDIHTMQVAFRELKQNEKEGFYIGLLSGLGSYAGMRLASYSVNNSKGYY